MFYAILAYHVEQTVTSWTDEQDAGVMAGLLAVHEDLERERSLGPSARLGPTGQAITLRGEGKGVVVDGPFAETKEQLLGFYVVDVGSREEAIEAARALRKANPTAVYEIRPIILYKSGTPLDGDG